MTPSSQSENGLTSPVEDLDTGSVHKAPAQGVGLCLSGGGFRAMLFHLGALWRLNEVGYLTPDAKIVSGAPGGESVLGSLARVSSVSGGSITSGVLGHKWRQLAFAASGLATRFVDEVVEPVRALAGETLDVGSVLRGWLLPGSANSRLAKAYRKHLFGDATLQDLPDAPRFVINAVNVQSGALWRFMKPYMRDWRVGEIRNPQVLLADAVAASTAFPPVLAPAEFHWREADYAPKSGKDLQRPPYTTTVMLADGGLYDNLGLETVWKRCRTILVSDAGAKMNPDPSPGRDPIAQTRRSLDVVDNQVRSLRKRQLIDSYVRNERSGVYWGIRSNIADYGGSNVLPCPHQKTMLLATIPTRLSRVEPLLQERLINWGYAVCDAALRAHVDSSLNPPNSFPYPKAGVG